MYIKVVFNDPNIEDVVNSNTGKVISILSKINPSGSVSLEFISEIIVPATLHEQIAFFYDISNEPIGFITWCKLNKRTFIDYIKIPNFKLHFSEWSEGDEIFINCLYCTKSSLIPICKKVASGGVIPERTFMYQHKKFIKSISIDNLL
ncbi:toxin-activating lysine-acyltransferase [Vibrio mediterranei]|jgi:hypothetical protein|uniref:toxin-activating lysine-acyltransferase n=1 Tax=Vibrio mediterranei TaxID=689 RepID=UPI0022844C0F|nr:toxin-activating lysine-acyltransferase [Vibrio mediterranei]MCY9855129.1 toxin-activating lysine-acyltransferase [Vibrio mediterranei]